MALLIATKFPHVLYDNSVTWRVRAAILLSSVPNCLVSGRWLSPKAKGDHPNRNLFTPSVLWHCWLGGRKGIRPVKNMGELWVWERR